MNFKGSLLRNWQFLFKKLEFSKTERRGSTIDQHWSRCIGKFSPSPYQRKPSHSSDEVWFHISLQNEGHWSAENPHLIHEVPFYPQKVGVCCAINAKRIIEHKAVTFPQFSTTPSSY